MKESILGMGDTREISPSGVSALDHKGEKGVKTEKAGTRL